MMNDVRKIEKGAQCVKLPKGIEVKVDMREAN